MAREYLVMREPRRPPTHPAALMREDVLPAQDVSVAQAARDLGVTRQTLHRLLAEKIGVSPEMAVRLGKFCGNGPDLWLRMQAAHDIWHAERKMKAQIARIPTRRADKAAA